MSFWCISLLKPVFLQFPEPVDTKRESDIKFVKDRNEFDSITTLENQKKVYLPSQNLTKLSRGEDDGNDSIIHVKINPWQDFKPINQVSKLMESNYATKEYGVALLVEDYLSEEFKKKVDEEFKTKFTDELRAA